MAEAAPAAVFSVRGSIECIYRTRPTPLDKRNVRGEGRFLSHANLDGTVDWEHSLVALSALGNIGKSVQPPMQFVLYLLNIAIGAVCRRHHSTLVAGNDKWIDYYYAMQNDVAECMALNTAAAYECPTMIATKFPQASSTYEDAVAYITAIKLMWNFTDDKIVRLPEMFYGTWSDFLARYPVFGEVAGTVKNDVYLDKKRELEKRVAAPLATGNNKYLLEQVNGFDLSEIDKPALKACVTSFATSLAYNFRYVEGFPIPWDEANTKDLLRHLGGKPLTADHIINFMLYRKHRVETACNKSFSDHEDVKALSTIETWYCFFLRCLAVHDFRDPLTRCVVRLFHTSHPHSGGLGRFDYDVPMNNGFKVPVPTSIRDFDEILCNTILRCWMTERMHWFHQSSIKRNDGDLQQVILASVLWLQDLIKEKRLLLVNDVSRPAVLDRIARTLADEDFCQQPFAGHYQRMTNLRDAGMGVFDKKKWKKATKRDEMVATREAALQAADVAAE